MEEALRDSFPKVNQSKLQQEQQQQHHHHHHQTQMTSQHLFLRSPSGQTAHLQSAPSRRAGAAAPSGLYVEHSPESTAFGSSLANSSDQSNLSESTSNRSPNPNFRGRIFSRPPASALYSTRAFCPSTMQITTVALNQDHNLSSAIEYTAASSNTNLMQNKHLLPASTDQCAATTTLSFENAASARGAGGGGAGLSADINAPPTSNKLRTSWSTSYEDKSTLSAGGLNLSPLVLIQGDEVIDHGPEVLSSHATATLLQVGDMPFGSHAQANMDNLYLHSSNNSTCNALADANIVQEAAFVARYNDQGLPEGLKVSLGQAQGGHVAGTGNLEEQYSLYDRFSGSVSAQLVTGSSGTCNRGGGGGPADRRHDQSYTNVVSRHHIQDHQVATWGCANNANSATTGSTELLLLPRIDHGGANGSHHAFSHSMTSSTTHAAAPPQVSSLHYNQSHAPQLLLAAAMGDTRHSNNNYSSCASGAGSSFLLPSSSMQQEVPNSEHHDQYAWDKTPEMALAKGFNINNAAQNLNRHLQRTFNAEGEEKFCSNLRQSGDLSLFFSPPPDTTPQQHRSASLSTLDSRLSHSGSLGVLRSSRYLRAAQQLLDEFCNVGRGNAKNEEQHQPWADHQHGTAKAASLSANHAFNKQPDNIAPSTSKPPSSAKATDDSHHHHHHHQTSDPDYSAPARPGSAADRSSSQQSAAAAQVDNSSSKQLPADERCHLQMKKARLIAMVEELDRRYRQYRDQMQLVVTSFESAAGLGAAGPYTALARRAMSRHFRGLRDAMGAHIRAACEALGEEVASAAPILSRGETPRLRLLDQRLRHHRALQQIGLLQHQAWRPQRGLPERSVSVLRSWLFEHFLHPYPKDSDKLMLARLTGLTRNQVSNWFINARVRLWKPMVEEMYNEEKKELEREAAAAAAAAATSTDQMLAKDGSTNVGGPSEAFLQVGAAGRSDQIARSSLRDHQCTASDKPDMISGKHKATAPSFPASFPNTYNVSNSTTSIHQLLADDDTTRPHSRGQYYHQIDEQPDMTALGGALTSFTNSYNQHNEHHQYALDHHQQLMRSQHTLPTDVGNVHGLNSNAILQNQSVIKNGVTLTLGLQQSSGDQLNAFHNHHIGDMQHLYNEPRHSDILRF